MAKTVSDLRKGSNRQETELIEGRKNKAFHT